MLPAARCEGQRNALRCPMQRAAMDDAPHCLICCSQTRWLFQPHTKAVLPYLIGRFGQSIQARWSSLRGGPIGSIILMRAVCVPGQSGERHQQM